MSLIPIDQNASHTYSHQLSGLEARPNQKVENFRHDRQRAKRAASEQPIFSSFCTSAIDPLKESLQEKSQAPNPSKRDGIALLRIKREK